MNAALALVDTLLVIGTILCAVLGRRAIHRRRVIAHRNLMIGAFVCSALFLALFVYRFVVYGFARFDGEGAWRVVYYGLLFAHEPIAVLSVPMVIVTFVLGLARSRFHIEVARTTYALWLASSVTGVLVYVVLHALPIGR